MGKKDEDFDLSKIKPLISKLPPVLKPVAVLSFDDCVKEREKLHAQMRIIHNLPKVGDDTSMEYMHETLDLMRQRFNALNWRMIEIQSAISRKASKARTNAWLKSWENSLQADKSKL